MVNFKVKLENAINWLLGRGAEATADSGESDEYKDGVALLGQIRTWHNDGGRGDHRIEWSELKQLIHTKMSDGKSAVRVRNAVKAGAAEALLSALEQNVRSIVLVTQRSRLTIYPKSQTCKVPSQKLQRRILRQDKVFCGDAPYAEQASARFFGTGFFVAENTIATAAHVLSLLSNGIDVNDIAFIRGYILDTPKKYNKGVIVPLSDVFIPDVPMGPGQVLTCDYSAAGHDWALVKVRPMVPSGKPVVTVSLASSSSLKPGAQLYSMGHGLGLPLKISYEGNVIRNDPDTPFFENSLTLLGGNSGSPVFNADHEVVGIYVRGTHKIQESAEGCLCIRDEANPYEGQECQRIEPVLKALKNWPAR